MLRPSRSSHKPWQRILQPMLAHPGLAVCAAIILLTGLGLCILPSTSDKPVLGDGQIIPLQDVATRVDHRSSISESDTVADTISINPDPATVDDTALNNGETITVLQASVAAPLSTELEPQTPAATIAPELTSRLITVESGDSLGSIFSDQQLSPKLLHDIINLDDRAASLKHIDVGEQLTFRFYPDGNLAELRREHGLQDWLVISRNPSQDKPLSARLEPRNIERRLAEASGIIIGNLFISAQQAGLRDGTILEMARIFAWDIDFALDIRSGDRFAVIYEQLWRDGEYLRDGDIIATRFVNQGEAFEALQFDTGDELDYFAPDGKPMRKAFLRAPVDFTRISSNFNPRRLHPVLKRVRPHNGTDYAARSGTPVFAAGSGKVIRAGYSAPNGNHVFIDHPNGVVTKYLHFSKTAVRLGQRVKQGQTIGYVGATGLATAPHLHYEFLQNGVHRDPRTVKLPSGVPLKPEQVEMMLQQHHDSVQRLATLDASLQPSTLAATGSQ